MPLGHQVIGQMSMKKSGFSKKQRGPTHEPNLETLRRSTGNWRLSFTIGMFPAIKTTDVIMIAVSTPQLQMVG
jgi:UDP-glucose 6-dehydrogenase